MTESDRPTPFRYHLELTPAQLKLTHTALRSLIDDYGHEDGALIAVLREVLAMLPDESAIAAIDLERELARARAGQGAAAGGEPEAPPQLADHRPPEPDGPDDGAA